MQQRQLGQLSVSAMGLGCMGFSQGYGRSDDLQALRTLQETVEMGINFFDTADMYGMGHNEKLLNPFIKNHAREKIILASKCGFVSYGNDNYTIDGSYSYIKKACEASLKRLGVDYLDLYYLHRADKTIPIEESMRALSELVVEGKIRHVGLSEVSADTLIRAHAVHPITALQSEYSLWHRFPEADVIPLCEKLGIGFVAYSPLGRGFFAGAVRNQNELNQLEPADFRFILPKTNDPVNLNHNLKLLEVVEDFAKQKNASSAQMALAFVLARAKHIVPIFGTRHAHRVRDNLKALDLHLNAEELAYLDQQIPVGAALGAQYPEYLNFKV